VPLLLRKIRKSKWYKNESVPWLQEDQIQADALGDLVTSSNSLSVWLVNDDQSNLEQVVVALASTCDFVSNIDYALFKVELLSGIGIEIEPNEGLTPYSEANHWHRDLTRITARKLIKLAELIYTDAQRMRIPEKKVLGLIKDAVKNKQIDIVDLQENIAKKVR